jgi:hypothetical protein
MLEFQSGFTLPLVTAYRSGPVTVPAGYQPVGSKFLKFEFQKLKNVERIPKNTSWFIESNYVKFVANFVHLV